MSHDQPTVIVDSGASYVGLNAYELADELQACFTKADWGYVEETAIMLRQLKAENDALRKTVDSLFAGLDSSLRLNKAQAERQEK
jgi:hypothetical protein